MRKQYRLKSEVSVSNSTSINFVTKPTNEHDGTRQRIFRIKPRATILLKISAPRENDTLFGWYKDANTVYVTHRERIIIQRGNLGWLFNEANCDTHGNAFGYYK